MQHSCGERAELPSQYYFTEGSGQAGREARLIINRVRTESTNTGRHSTPSLKTTYLSIATAIYNYRHDSGSASTFEDTSKQNHYFLKL